MRLFLGVSRIDSGQGAFAIKPNKDDKDKQLKNFIQMVSEANFIDRASQRENVAVKVYEIQANRKDILNEPIPEYLNGKKIITQ
jgi:hypothetical protein